MNPTIAHPREPAGSQFITGDDVLRDESEVDRSIPCRRRPVYRPGFAAVMAMLYLMLFSVLAVGFFAASTLSVEIACNDRSAADAQSAAESGLQFVHYRLGKLALAPDLSDADTLALLATLLGDQLDASANMKGHRVVVRDGAIALPGADDFMALDSSLGTRFRATLRVRQSSVLVTVVGAGRNSAIRRAVQLRFDPSFREGVGNVLVPATDSYEEATP